MTTMTTERPYTVVCGQEDRAKWLAARKAGLGGSDAGAILGLSKWRTPLAVWVDKTTPTVEAEQETADQRWGTLKEPLILREYARETGAELQMMEMLRSRHHPFMLATLDALAHHPDGTVRVVDAKSHRTDDGYGEPGTDEIPPSEAAQAHHYMTVTGVQRVDFAVLIGSADFRIYTVHADPDLQAGLVDAEAQFWEQVQTKTPPAPRTVEDVKAMFPRHKEGLRVVADDTLRVAVGKLRSCKTEIEVLEAMAEAAEVQIKKAMGEAQELVDGDKVLATWKTSKPRESLDREALERDHPGIIKKYTVPGNAARPFLLKGVK